MLGDNTVDGKVEDAFHQAEIGQGETDGDFGEPEGGSLEIGDLRDLASPDADPGQEPEAWTLPPPPDHVTGTQLRKRIVTEESIARLEATKRPSLLQRIFRRK